MKPLYSLFFSLIYISSLHASSDSSARFYEYNGRILAKQPVPINEKDDPGNETYLQEQSKTFVKDGVLYDSKGALLDTNNDFFIYVISKKGILYTAAPISLTGARVHHSYLMKSKPSKEHFGIGKDIACAGHILVTQGKIVHMDNQSGHYKPNKEQLILEIQQLYKQDVLSPQATFHDASSNTNLDLQEILKTAPEMLLSPFHEKTKTIDSLPTQCPFISAADITKLMNRGYFQNSNGYTWYLDEYPKIQTAENHWEQIELPQHIKINSAGGGDPVQLQLDDKNRCTYIDVGHIYSSSEKLNNKAISLYIKPSLN